MIHGTILIVGSKRRELELVATRLENERYTLAHLSVGKVSTWLRRNRPQAVFFDVGLSRQQIEQVIRLVRSRPNQHRLPFILLGETEVPSTHSNITGIGEFMPLHTLPLAEVINRINFAIEVTELVTHHH